MAENDSPAQWLLLQGDRIIGGLELAPGVTLAEASAGDASPAGSRSRAHAVGEACDVDDHTPCDINVSVGYAQEIVEAEGLSVPAFDRLLSEGWDTPADVVAALRAVQDAAPEANRAEIAEVIGYVETAGGASTGTP